MSQQHTAHSVGEIAGQAMVISTNLAQRLNQFQNGYPDREQVSESTRAAIHELVCWLHNKSETVSATVSHDGLLTIAAVFPKDVRLYIEVERDGSAEAAVTRKRRYARDIAAERISDVTPEVVLAAVASIG